jgi:eukaryotic-like serine/threonine-protein kinase
VKKEFSKESREIAEKLLEYQEDEQPARLDLLCGDNPDLKKEVIEVLKEGKSAITFIENLKQRIFSFSDTAIASAGILPDRIGDYRIVRKIGSGGSATVYLARTETSGGVVEGALKVLRRDVARPDSRTRFEAERRILESLNHPNIARWIDGGITGEGDLYVVMEYADGLPIDVYCDENRLDIPTRLRLIQNVCKAVHYAHQNLVVHRDIKPDHVFVNSRGDIRLVDFGIAKLLEKEKSTTLEETFKTRTDIRVMTPDYASPEQVRGGTITTASDIYSLGVLLYVLLTGRKPYRAGQSSMLEIERIICQTDPVKPSDAVTGMPLPAGNDLSLEVYDRDLTAKNRGIDAQRLKRTLSGDLDRIVLMAMWKEPERRYASCIALSEDIERYLNGKPVHARPPAFQYRASKFLKRNKIPLAAAAIAILSLVGGFISTIWQARQAQEQARQAAIEREKAEQVSAFLVDMFQAGNPTRARGDTITAAQILEMGTLKADELSHQPDIQSHLFHVIGNTYFHLGLYDLARPVLEKALPIRELHFGDTDARVNDTRFLLATVYQIQGDRHRAISLFDAIVEAFQRSPRIINPEQPSRLINIGHIYNARRNFPLAEELYREAYEINMQLHGKNHIMTATSLRYLGDTVQKQQRFGEAENMYRESLAVFREVANDHPEMSYVYEGLAEIELKRGNVEPAIMFLREAIHLETRVQGPEFPPLSVKHQKLGNIYRDHGMPSHAATHYEQAHSRMIAAFGPHHILTGSLLIDMAVLKGHEDDVTAAENFFSEGLGIYRERLSPGNERLGLAYHQYGVFLTGGNRFEEAEKILLESFRIFDERSGTNPYYLIQRSETAASLVSLYENWNRPAEADPYREVMLISTSE